MEEGFDLSLRVIPVPDSSLIMRRLASFRFTVCGAPGYLAQRGTPIQLAALAARNCLIFTDSPFGKEWRFWAADGSEQDVPLSGTSQANSGDPRRKSLAVAWRRPRVPQRCVKNVCSTAGWNDAACARR